MESKHMVPSPLVPMHLLILALGPLCLALIASCMLWDNGTACYLFWKQWSQMHPLLTDSMMLITTWGNPAVYIAYALILHQALRHKRPDNIRLVICYILVQIAIALILTHTLKNVFGIPRPYTGETEPQQWSFLAMYQSFPSGHTTEIVGAVLPLALWRRRSCDALIGGLWIAAVAYSRIYLGVHYLTDVWGGLLLGCLSAGLILYLALFRRQDSGTSTAQQKT